MLLQTVPNSRRHNSRVETPEGVWVYWSCGRREDTARVRNLSRGGLFIETREPVIVGTKTKLDFLVQEGQIRAEALVQHIQSGRGVGLKFMAVRNGDLPHLAALLNRHTRSDFEVAKRQIGARPAT